MKKNIMFIRKRKKPRIKYYDDINGNYDDVDAVLMIIRMTKNFQKMIMIIMIMMKNVIKIKIIKE